MAQLLASMEWNLSVRYPTAYSRVMDGLSRVCFVDIPAVIPFRCAFTWGAESRLHFQTLWPLALIAGAWGYEVLVARHLRRQDRSRAGHGAVVFSLVLLYVVFPGVSQSIFQTFICERFDYPKAHKFAKVMAMDYQVSCRSSKYLRLRVYAAFFAAVYPAVPLFFSSSDAVLGSARKSTCSARSPFLVPKVRKL